ncbi:hypothetical protein BD626DRAFT_533886 [Schizophyllum amplum]|uniref:Uncharacterized protein n=1 Tax=Schizophyllum amplum TaxID=97359 RepID=A0A550CRK0_9AGAR|nr:hypothetical protein BD626DRAFT_533886 [Auriculariopsis ampla]
MSATYTTDSAYAYSQFGLEHDLSEPDMDVLLDMLLTPEGRDGLVDPTPYTPQSASTPAKTLAMPPPPLLFAFSGRPGLPALARADDLKVFISSRSYPTRSWESTATLAQIAAFYELDLRHLSDVDYSPSQDLTRSSCDWHLTGHRTCGLPIAQHIGEYLTTHTTPTDTVCRWSRCAYRIPLEMAARCKGLMTVHVTVRHLQVAVICPLCRCNLYQPPGLPEMSDKHKPYKLEAHLASGWCFGLAQVALSKGFAVPAPQGMLSPPKRRVLTIAQALGV